MFKEFGMVLLIIIIHELRHIISAKMFGWNFYKIKIYPFGGVSTFDEKINKPLIEELIILICGPIFQIVLFFIVYLFFIYGFVSFRNYLIFMNYHYTLLFFNLLPIYPLDGGRIINIVINKYFPYKKGNKFVILLSTIFILIMLLFYKSLNFSLMAILLIFELFLYFKRQNFLYNRMLLERYINNFSFKKFKVINSKDSMYKDKRHIILYKNKYITEKDYLNKRFKVRK